ncbi:hypothetical protein [Shinella zoogloeoides]|uniref:hypothetical protein n=1 Tax=Shinella zoogloeoides TaxID=352475 RepID=UPI001F59C412|nr:hypothetical protein [Shinella zoogloeoides]
MSDPYLAALRAARVGLLFSHPEEGMALARLIPREVANSVNGLECIGGDLLYEREYVKSLTHAELKTALLGIAIEARY